MNVGYRKTKSENYTYFRRVLCKQSCSTGENSLKKGFCEYDDYFTLKDPHVPQTR